MQSQNLRFLTCILYLQSVYFCQNWKSEKHLLIFYPIGRRKLFAFQSTSRWGFFFRPSKIGCRINWKSIQNQALKVCVFWQKVTRIRWQKVIQFWSANSKKPSFQQKSVNSESDSFCDTLRLKKWHIWKEHEIWKWVNSIGSATSNSIEIDCISIANTRSGNSSISIELFAREVRFLEDTFQSFPIAIFWCTYYFVRWQFDFLITRKSVVRVTKSRYGNRGFQTWVCLWLKHAIQLTRLAIQFTHTLRLSIDWFNPIAIIDIFNFKPTYNCIRLQLSHFQFETVNLLQFDCNQTAKQSIEPSIDSIMQSDCNQLIQLTHFVTKRFKIDTFQSKSDFQLQSNPRLIVNWQSGPSERQFDELINSAKLPSSRAFWLNFWRFLQKVHSGAFGGS